VLDCFVYIHCIGADARAFGLLVYPSAAMDRTERQDGGGGGDAATEDDDQPPAVQPDSSKSDNGEAEGEEEGKAGEEKKDDEGRDSDSAVDDSFDGGISEAGKRCGESDSDNDNDAGDDDEDNNEDDDDDDDNDNDESSDEDDDDDNDDDDDGDNQDSDGDEGSSSDDDEEAKESSSSRRMTVDGRELSEYEILRLERIKRNQEYLANLGLQGKNGAGVLGGKKKPRAPTKKKRSEDEESARQVVKRPKRKRKEVDYSEPSNSVASLLRQHKAKEGGEGKKEPVHRPIPKKKKDKAPVNRMELFLYREFKAIQKHKTDVLRQAERDVRASEKQVSYWFKKAERIELRREKKERRELQKKELEARIAAFNAEEMQMERNLLGCTKRELLGQVDERMPELLSAAGRYEQEAKVRSIAAYY